MSNLNVVNLVHTTDLDTEHFVLDQQAKKIKIKPELINPPREEVQLPDKIITELTVDEGQHLITWKENNVPKQFSFAALVTDVKVTSHRFEGGVLTLIQDSGPSVEIDLTKLSEVVTADTGNVKFTGKGTTADPLVANVELPEYTASKGVKKVGHDFQVDPAIFSVELKDAFGQNSLGFIYKPTE